MVELDEGLRDVLKLVEEGQDLGSDILGDVITYCESEGWHWLEPNDERSRLYLRLVECANRLSWFEDQAAFLSFENPYEPD